MCVKWGGHGLIYTCGRDTLVNVYNADNGTLVRSMKGHGHWVNTMSITTDFVLRSGPYDHTEKVPSSPQEAHEWAKKRYDEALSKMVGGTEERLVTGSDDGTLILCAPESSSAPVARLVGHQQQIMNVAFSPNGQLIASASYDKSLRLWNGITGKFKSTLRGHVGALYQLSWAPDSRLLVTGSRDSTLKLWNPATGKLEGDLPGHRDEVFTVDWATDGQHVATGSYDRTIKIWQH
eukprot:TRINITY_DN1698_c0_g1_i2.p1 TRINITY_DN1698_c0_g1~~TRINITY_DN1698_c0_g1_i2.p1  ORF type:complete len:235 (-),score=43.14 TRINITY_DN1698_c0_g1_i2:15-719(-)